ncbi:MAG: hypothetical protein F4X99_03285 [Gammaproteobacteria bacterium]|nr:hypothetical protein [Gammaproteobacteria bacterium]
MGLGSGNYTYAWNGGTSGIANRFYLFSSAGSYTVSVTVTDTTTGNTGTASITVTVRDDI